MALVDWLRDNSRRDDKYSRGGRGGGAVAKCTGECFGRILTACSSSSGGGAEAMVVHAAP